MEVFKFSYLETMLSNETKLQKVGEAGRNELGQLLPGSVLNPYGRGKVGHTVAESYRKFLSARDQKRNKSRLRINQETLYEISIDKTHKQCVEAIKYLDARAYGDIPKEVSQSVMAMALLHMLPEAHKAFLAELMTQGDEAMLLPAEVEDDEIEEVGEKQLEAGVLRE